MKYFDVYYDNISGKKINNFRPRISIGNIKTLYYTKGYKKQLPILANKLGIGSFLHLSSFLKSDYPTFLETSSLIRKIIFNRKKINEACIEYEDKNDRYQTLIRKKMTDGLK